MNIADYISAFPGATDDDLISAGFAPQSVQAFRDGYMAPPSGDPSKIQPTVMPANTFGDVASQYGNEYISGGMDLAFNPNVSSYDALPQSMQGGFMEPFNREVMSILDLPLGLLSGVYGLAQKATALGAEAIGSGTQSEERLARDWIGGVEGSGFAPEGRMLAAIADAGGIGAAGRKIAERANQPGPVPTMYSNPIGRALGGAGKKNESFDIVRKDASSIFGAGTERVRYTDPKSGGTMEVVVRPDGSASVLELEVPEASRGKGIGQSLQERVMQDFPVMGGQVSSKAAATTAYRLGRRPVGKPNATLEDVFAEMDDMSSVNMISPQMQALRTPADPVAVRGAEVMDMLKSGRGSDVTDQMLDMGDPVLNARLNEYLYKNADIPMDEASRMARAGDIQAYHGTLANFPAFDGRSYAASGFGTHMGGKEAADTILKNKRSPYGPKDAPTYVEGSQVLPLRVDAGPMLRVNDTETWNPNATQFAMAWSDDPAAVAAYNRIQANPDYPKFGTEAEQSAFMQKQLEQDGIGGFVYNNTFEGGGDSYAVLNPANIRSRFARFDPRLSHLKNLSAGIGGAAVLSALGDDAEAGTQIMDLVNQSGISGAAQILGVSQRDVEEAISIAVPPSQWDQLVVGPQ